MNARAKAQQVEMINTLQQIILTAFGTSRESVRAKLDAIKERDELAEEERCQQRIEDHEADKQHRAIYGDELDQPELPGQRRRHAEAQAGHQRYADALADHEASQSEVLDDIAEVARITRDGK